MFIAEKLCLFLIVVILYFFDNILAETQSLYTPEDDIFELNGENFNNNVYNKSTAFVMEFYSSWCGHCINYAPHYVKFSKLLKTWRKVVVVAAINCADEKNAFICREHDIDAFPTLKYFKVNSQSKADSIKYLKSKEDLITFSLFVAQQIDNDYNIFKPTTWPDYKNYMNNLEQNVKNYWNLKSSENATYLGFFIEETISPNAIALVTNYNLNQIIKVYSLDFSHPIATELNNTEFPSFTIFERNNLKEVFKFTIGDNSWNTTKYEIDVFLLKNSILFKNLNDEANSNSINNQTIATNFLHQEQFEVQLMDIKKTLLYMLTQEIPRKLTIEKEKFNALKIWLNVLKKYCPVTPAIQNLFYKLEEWLKDQSYKNSTSSKDWLKAIETYQSDFGHPLPTNISYLACQGSKPYLRGYTCGLWTIFHVITVKAYLDEKENINFKPYDDVLKPIYDFIVQFLSCEICAKNFKKLSENENLQNVVKREDTVLWLWKAHNLVNLRLSGEASDDPYYPKQQFPPEKICLVCRNSDKTFNTNETLNFLLHYYSDIKMTTIENSFFYEMKEINNGKVEKIINREFNPKFANLAQKEFDEENKRIDQLIEPIQGSFTQNSVYSSNPKFLYLFWLIIIGVVLSIIIVKYKQNRSKFWKAFYYYNDYKLVTETKFKN